MCHLGNQKGPLVHTCSHLQCKFDVVLFHPKKFFDEEQSHESNQRGVDKACQYKHHLFAHSVKAREHFFESCLFSPWFIPLEIPVNKSLYIRNSDDAKNFLTMIRYSVKIIEGV